MVFNGTKDVNEGSQGSDGTLLIVPDSHDFPLAMGGSCITDAVAMVGSEEVVGEVKLKLVNDPHVGTDSEVVRATISPDPDC